VIRIKNVKTFFYIYGCHSLHTQSTRPSPSRDTFAHRHTHSSLIVMTS